MGLISPGGENLLDFLELRQVLSTYDGTTGTRSGGLREGQSPCELLRGLSGFLSRLCRGLRPCVESVPEPENSSPVLTWILGVLLESPQGSQSSSRARRRKRVSSGCVRDSPDSSRVETGMSGNFLSCSKGVKDPLEVSDVRCD